MFLKTDAVTLCQITNSYMTIGLRNLSETFQCFKVFSRGLEEKCYSQNILESNVSQNDAVTVCQI
jgi:hypothetical protein